MQDKKASAPWVERHQVEQRFPRLIDCVQFVGILSRSEAECCIRDYLNARNGKHDMASGEAVQHYGGPDKLIKDACKQWVRGAMHRRYRTHGYAMESHVPTDVQKGL